RRHTRSKRDWSSDVCSSDLAFDLTVGDPRHPAHPANLLIHPANLEKSAQVDVGPTVGEASEAPFQSKSPGRHVVELEVGILGARSEERRVGKEGRGGWWRGD